MFWGVLQFWGCWWPPLAMSEHQMCTHKSSPKYQRTVIGTGDFAHLVLMQKCVKLPGRECVYSPSESRSIRASIRPQTPARVVQTCQSRSAFLQKPKHLKNMTIFWSFSLFFLLISTSMWDKIKNSVCGTPEFHWIHRRLEASKPQTDFRSTFFFFHKKRNIPWGDSPQKKFCWQGVTELKRLFDAILGQFFFFPPESSNPSCGFSDPSEKS